MLPGVTHFNLLDYATNPLGEWLVETGANTKKASPEDWTPQDIAAQLREDVLGTGLEFADFIAHEVTENGLLELPRVNLVGTDGGRVAYIQHEPELRAGQLVQATLSTKKKTKKNRTRDSCHRAQSCSRGRPRP